MLTAVKVVHDHGIVHCDLKPHNFILFRQRSRDHLEGGDTGASVLFEHEKFMLKLCDFGVSRKLEDSATHVSESAPIGTVRYMAPEVLHDCRSDGKLLVGKAADKWSIGVLLHQMLHQGLTPHSHIERRGIKVRLMLAIADEKSARVKTSCPRLLLSQPSHGDESAARLASARHAILMGLQSTCLQFCPKERASTEHLVSVTEENKTLFFDPDEHQFPSGGPTEGSTDIVDDSENEVLLVDWNDVAIDHAAEVVGMFDAQADEEPRRSSDERSSLVPFPRVDHVRAPDGETWAQGSVMGVINDVDGARNHPEAERDLERGGSDEFPNHPRRCSFRCKVLAIVALVAVGVAASIGIGLSIGLSKAPPGPQQPEDQDSPVVVQDLSPTQPHISTSTDSTAPAQHISGTPTPPPALPLPLPQPTGGHAETTMPPRQNHDAPAPPTVLPRPPPTPSPPESSSQYEADLALLKDYLKHKGACLNSSVLDRLRGKTEPITEISAPEPITEISALLLKDGSQIVGRKASRVLVQLAENGKNVDEVIATFSARLTDETSLVRIDAINALLAQLAGGDLDRAEVILIAGVILIALRTMGSSPPLRAQAVKALAQLGMKGSRAIIKTVSDCLGDPSGVVRAAAAKALGVLAEKDDAQVIASGMETWMTSIDYLLHDEPHASGYYTEVIEALAQLAEKDNGEVIKAVVAHLKPSGLAVTLLRRCSRYF